LECSLLFLKQLTADLQSAISNQQSASAKFFTAKQQSAHNFPSRQQPAPKRQKCGDRRISCDMIGASAILAQRHETTWDS
jgi:hypothetical protein